MVTRVLGATKSSNLIVDAATQHHDPCGVTGCAFFGPRWLGSAVSRMRHVVRSVETSSSCDSLSLTGTVATRISGSASLPACKASGEFVYS